jgi:hypothetical protein
MINDIDIPIINKTSDLYRTFHDYRKIIPKQDRFTIYERSEQLIIDIIESFFEAGYFKGNAKVSVLDKASIRLNTLRFFIRTLKDIKSIDNKKYIILQSMIDEIGRMLGGWIRSLNAKY